eukprot:1140865-Pelagomonas_calceolata.AAC.2
MGVLGLKYDCLSHANFFPNQQSTFYLFTGPAPSAPGGGSRGDVNQPPSARSSFRPPQDTSMPPQEPEDPTPGVRRDIPDMAMNAGL